MNLKLSENFLDETETNMETEEECLGEVLQNWLLYHNPTLETLNPYTAFYMYICTYESLIRRKKVMKKRSLGPGNEPGTPNGA